jgi:hypothetical protein
MHFYCTATDGTAFTVVHVITNYTVQCTYVDVIKEEEVTGSEVKMENGTAEVSENGTQEEGEFPDTSNFIENKFLIPNGS